MQRPGSFGALLQQHRIAAGLSQEELAERAGLSRRCTSDLERGTRQAPYPATVRRLAQALGLADEARVEFLHARRPRVKSAPEPQPMPASAVALIEADQSASHTWGRAADQKRHNLPAELNGFVGRGRELATVQQLPR